MQADEVMCDAERVGMERTHLYRKLKQLGIEIGEKDED